MRAGVRHVESRSEACREQEARRVQEAWREQEA